MPPHINIPLDLISKEGGSKIWSCDMFNFTEDISKTPSPTFDVLQVL